MSCRANLLPSAPPEEPLSTTSIAAWKFPFANLNDQRDSQDFGTNKSTTIASLLKNTNGQKKSWTGALPAPVFSWQRFPALVLVFPYFCRWPAGYSSIRWCWRLFRSRFFGADSQKTFDENQKHQEITTLAIAKHDTVNRLLSKALIDNTVSAREFDIILSEFE